MARDEERIDRVREGIAAAGLDALVCRLSGNVVFLTGYYPIIGQSWVVYAGSAEPILVVPDYERDLAEATGIGDIRTFDCWRLSDTSIPDSHRRILSQVCADLRLAGARVGIEGSSETLAPEQLSGEPAVIAAPTRRMLEGVFGAPGLVDATKLLDQLRALKTPTELARIRLANRVACQGLLEFKSQAQPGRREAEVAAAVEARVAVEGVTSLGARSARAWAQVSSGPRTESGWYYAVSSARVIEAGELVMLELATVVDGYWSDLTRTIVAGRASERQRGVYAAVKAAQQASLAADRPGVRTREVDAAARGILYEHGLGEFFVHHTGHGLGFRYHEPVPSITPSSEGAMAVGHVHSVEPGVYVPGFGGIRLEDDVVVTPDGPEVLSPTDFGLD